MNNRKVIIFSAPSGAGKSTIVGMMIKQFPQLEFSISATSRSPRGTETHGKEDYFFDTPTFRKMIDDGAFVEYEEVYSGSYYGTLKSELERIWGKGKTIVFDIDVKGGMNLKRIFGDNALSIFIKAPSVEELRRRLLSRGTDSPESIEKRIAKAEEENGFADRFDTVVTNDNLDKAVAETARKIREFIG